MYGIAGVVCVLWLGYILRVMCFVLCVARVVYAGVVRACVCVLLCVCCVGAYCVCR